MKCRINKFDKIEAYDVHAKNLGKCNTWWEVSRTTFAYNLQLLKMGFFLFSFLGKATYACKSRLLCPGEDWST